MSSEEEAEGREGRRQEETRRERQVSGGSGDVGCSGRGVAIGCVEADSGGRRSARQSVGQQADDASA